MRLESSTTNRLHHVVDSCINAHTVERASVANELKKEWNKCMSVHAYASVRMLA